VLPDGLRYKLKLRRLNRSIDDLVLCEKSIDDDTSCS